jgi:outer membrane protein OmpA-like peptidoglycan-associated protein
VPDDLSNVLPDKPKVDQPDVNSVMTEIERTTAQVLSQNPSATREQSLLNDTANSGRPQPALTGTELATSTTIKRPSSFNSNIPHDSAGPTTGRAPGFSDLESLLSQKGPLGSGTAIKMPEDQLFEFGSSDLQSSAIQQLQKLGTLIKRNPNAKFTIEGYTDSIGDDDFNMQLSQQRAEAVRDYLVGGIGISPAQVAARGYGKSKFLVAPRPTVGMSDAELTAEIARQQPNRRVVVVVDTSTR